MSWTYTGEIVSTRDQVRFLIGDTIASDPQLTDQEVEYLLTTYVTVGKAAIAACRTLAAKYARYSDKWVGDLKILASQRVKHYLDLAKELETSPVGAATSGLCAPSAGGISVAAKQEQEADTDRVAPFFTRGRDDNTSES